MPATGLSAKTRAKRSDLLSQGHRFGHFFTGLNQDKPAACVIDTSFAAWSGGAAKIDRAIPSPTFLAMAASPGSSLDTAFDVAPLGPISVPFLFTSVPLLSSTSLATPVQPTIAVIENHAPNQQRRKNESFPKHWWSPSGGRRRRGWFSELPTGGSQTVRPTASLATNWLMSPSFTPGPAGEEKGTRLVSKSVLKWLKSIQTTPHYCQLVAEGSAKSI
ncbi:MAG TPA: hypothetical protein VGX78_12355 [Pirellulales bacterium]|jgi:hypothetical protein|nr:hypothetical protein [Pirellulales bacterium]